MLLLPPHKLRRELIVCCPRRLSRLPCPGLHEQAVVDVDIEGVSGGGVALLVVGQQLPDGVGEEQGVPEGEQRSEDINVILNLRFIYSSD